MLQKALIHLLQSHVRKPIKVDQHFVGFLKAIEPGRHDKATYFNPYENKGDPVFYGQGNHCLESYIFQQHIARPVPETDKWVLNMNILTCVSELE